MALGPGDAALLGGLNISLEAKARITAALQAGQVVLVPTQSALIDRAATVGWYEIDPTTGVTLDVLEDGSHAARQPPRSQRGGTINEYFAVLANTALIIARVLAPVEEGLVAAARTVPLVLARIRGLVAAAKAYAKKNPGAVGIGSAASGGVLAAIFAEISAFFSLKNSPQAAFGNATVSNFGSSRFLVGNFSAQKRL